MYKFYNFQCKDCKVEERLACWEDKIHDQKCTKCKGALILKEDITKGDCALYIPFKSGWYEHIAKDPIYIKDKYALRAACKEHNMGSAYLDDM